MLRLPTENTLDREENIMAEWINTTLEECTDILGDGLHGTPKYTENGEYAFVNGNNLVDGEILIKKETKRVDYSQYDKYKKPLTNRTILVSINGTLGNVGVYGSEKIILGKSACYFNVKESVDKDFIYYIVSSPTFKHYLESNATGTTIKNISLKQMRKYTFELPEIGEQKRISSVLRKIDEKIKNNRAINKNLEQQAQAIFKSWFINFEPFSNRKPSGWSVLTLGNVSIMGAGGDKPQNVSPIRTDLYEYPIYSNGLSNEGLYGFTDKPKISEESVTVSARGTIGFVCLRHIPYVPIVRLVTLIPKTEIISAKYLYLWLKQLHITGTGTTQQQLTVPDFQKTEILVPSQEIVTLFTATVEPIFEKIWANQNENEKLSSLRDTLLPKLMSGELDVSDTEI